jgi:hypothetical protein
MAPVESSPASPERRQGPLAKAVGIIVIAIVGGWFAVFAIALVIFVVQAVSQ